MQGMALLPIPSAHLPREENQSQHPREHQEPDALLARVSFVGDLFLDACFLFTPILDRPQQPPQQIALSSPIANAAERQADRQAGRKADRQADGQLERRTGRQGLEGAGPVRPTARRQTGEAILQAMGVAAGQANTSRTQVRTPPAPTPFALALLFFFACRAQVSEEGHGLQADLTSSRQLQKAKTAVERHTLLGSERVQDPPQLAPPETDVPQAGSAQTSMLRNLDVRQNLSSRAALK